jgi:hypothetical protein
MAPDDRAKIAAVMNRLKPRGEGATVGERFVWRKVVLGIGELVPEPDRASFEEACGLERNSLTG